MIDVVDDLMLHQHVSTPTRILIDQNASLLDLLLTKFPDTLSDFIPDVSAASATFIKGQVKMEYMPPLFSVVSKLMRALRCMWIHLLR